MRSQFRWVHVGVTAALAAATLTAVGLAQSVRASGGGTASSYVPITPCRLVDTRTGSNNVGSLAAPLGPGETVTLAVWGTNGDCTIPNNATGIAANVTAVNPTAGSFVTVYPADADPRPAASNLNVVAGGAPTPNQVTVGLSSAGAISVYNNGGTVDIVIDVVGYYQPEATVTQGPPGPAGPTCPTSSGCTVFYTGIDVGSNLPAQVTAQLCVYLDPAGDFYLAFTDVPSGARINSVRIRYVDSGAGDATFTLRTVDEAFAITNQSATFTTSDASSAQAALQLNAARPPQGRSTQYQIRIHPTGQNTTFCGAEVNYAFP
ncbi:MAG: hypothetical protein JWL72_4033 [Ilumatobacteraceae bacterium]|nr:hypothetical protein [Ilumatobacteraceae bacterium]